MRGLDLVGNAPRVAAEAAALLDAPACPAAVTDVILEGSQVALQIHESVGHATEGDRILGWEAAFAGTSFLDPAELGRLRYGSELMHVTADATVPGALGTFGFDDEGTPARAVDLVRDGIWVGVLSGRDSAVLLGVRARRDGGRPGLRRPADGADDEREPPARAPTASRRSSPTPTTGSTWPPTARGPSTTSG